MHKADETKGLTDLAGTLAAAPADAAAITKDAPTADAVRESSAVRAAAQRLNTAMARAALTGVALQVNVRSMASVGDIPRVPQVTVMALAKGAEQIAADV